MPVVPEDVNIEFRFPNEAGAWDDLAFRYREGPWIALAKGGGVWPRWASASAVTRFRRIGNSVVADVVAKGGQVEEVRFGGADVGEDADIVLVPYYTYSRPGIADRPCVISARIGEVPLGRLATSQDVANAVLYLASEEASFLNGVALPIDGGVTCY